MVVMLFSAFVGFIPVKTEAAHSPSSGGGNAALSLEQIKKYINEEYLKYNFETAEEMLAVELEKGYLDYVTSADGRYTMYVNRYTGFLFYRNNYTGQILTSNPINPGYTSNVDSAPLMSQIYVEMFEASNTTKSYNYNSIDWSSRYGQITVNPIANGLRVNYTIGDTAARFLLPGLITAEKFEKNILGVLIQQYEETIAILCPDLPIEFLSDYDNYTDSGYISSKALRSFVNRANKIMESRYGKNSKTYTSFYQLSRELTQLSEAYNIQDPAEFIDDPIFAEMLQSMYENYPITQQGIAIYECKFKSEQPEKQREISNIIKKYCPEYNMNMMFDDEAECGYTHIVEQKPVLRCSLEYTFNTDGSLSVRLPASSISFDETMYTLRSITPLQYFGYGDMATDGYIFYPDGSGTVVEFEDFYNKNVSLSLYADVYGQDYCYSTITEGAHRKQITMPVYGLINETTPNATTATALDAAGALAPESIKNGFFAILEEGAALARLNYTSDGKKFVSVYASFRPYPQDTFDLSETLSVGGLGEYIMVSNSKYTGSYVTRYKMLSDESIGKPLFGAGKYYDASYSGMAEYYRNYLKADGTLGVLDKVSEDLPLYIEALGSMTITSKFLTFPVEESIALTSFADVLTMYKQLSNSKAHVQSLIDECEAKLAEEDISDYDIVNYTHKLEVYKDLITKIQNINNINFKLTGFANDGMYFTYPNKVRWESVCGGDDGFEHLAAETKRISAADGINFSIYPEFDFMYISNTALFDGISERSSVSRMVDNRYASKQVYQSVMQEFESLFTMVVSSHALNGLYTEFNEEYSEYDMSTLSVSTLGSDVNSNFDEDRPINRDQAVDDITALLKRMSVNDGYDLMIDTGNIFAVKYAKHILNIATDSSHPTYSSYAVPFIGMILHGHVSYAGSPINYTGSPDYEILRSIENGAAPYYILCYENTEHMKDDEQLNGYYGVNYQNWYDELLLTYAELNDQIGSLQDYEIVHHTTLVTERKVSEQEEAQMYANLVAEYFELLEGQLIVRINETFDALKASNMYEQRIKVSFNKEAIAAQFRAIVFGIDLEFDAEAFAEALDALEEKYTAEYPGVAGVSESPYNVNVTINAVENYKSQYKYKTDSDALDEDYEHTEFTIDSGRVVMVTYKKGNDVVRFVLNYNIYSVDVTIDGETFTLDKYEYKKLEG